MELHNLSRTKPMGYTTWGCMWKRGECAPETEYICVGEAGDRVELQSRITAYWPDGSVKWTAHTADASLLGSSMEVTAGECGTPVHTGLEITETGSTIIITTACFAMHITKDGPMLFDTIKMDGKTVLEKARSVLELEHPVEGIRNVCNARAVKEYNSQIEHITVEEAGPLQAVIKYEGIHRAEDGRVRIPFVVRMTVVRDLCDIRLTHMFIFRMTSSLQNQMERLGTGSLPCLSLRRQWGLMAQRGLDCRGLRRKRGVFYCRL